MNFTYFLELDKLRYTGRPARPDTVAALKVEWVNPGSWTGELPAEKDLVSTWMITLFVFPGIELKTRHKLIFFNIYDFYTVKPLITNTSEEFIKCRLDNFSTSFIL